MDPLPSLKPDEEEAALGDPRNFINREPSNRVRPAPGAAPVRSQERFAALARRAAFADASRPASVEPLLSAPRSEPGRHRPR